MKRTYKKFLLCSVLGLAILSLAGCRSLAEEDPNEQQIPWATPADWEGQMPGMPTGGRGF